MIEYWSVNKQDLQQAQIIRDKMSKNWKRLKYNSNIIVI